MGSLRRLRGPILILVAAGVAGAGAVLYETTRGGSGDSTTPPTPTPTRTAEPATLANVFVDTTAAGNACRRSASPANYRSGSACDSFDAAYHAAHQGDLVLVKAGTYAAQTIEDDATKHTGLCDVGNTGPCVRFKPYPGDRVTVADLTNHAWNAYYDGFTFEMTEAADDGGPAVTQGTGVVLADMRATQFFIQSQSQANPVVNVHVDGGEYGPLITCPGGGIEIGTDGASAAWQAPKNVTVEGVYVHDFKITQGCAQNHMDCVHARPTVGYFRFIRNRFDDCQDYALLLEGNHNLDASWHVTIANNMVGPDVAGTESIAFRGDEANPEQFPGTIRVVNNSADGAVSPATHNDLSGDIVFANNYAPSVGACRTGITYSHNVMSSGPGCGAGDVSGTSFGWKDRGGADLHLEADATAIDAGDHRYCPAVDFDDQRRSGSCDAGADQR